MKRTFYQTGQSGGKNTNLSVDVRNCFSMAILLRDVFGRSTRDGKHSFFSLEVAVSVFGPGAGKIKAD